jgi:hypothetical protein
MDFIPQTEFFIQHRIQTFTRVRSPNETPPSIRAKINPARLLRWIFAGRMRPWLSHFLTPAGRFVHNFDISGCAGAFPNITK